MKSAFLFLFLIATACAQVGPLPGGRFLLNTGWILQPAGKQVPLDTFPMASALSRDGKYLLVLNAGVRPPSISVLETATARETARVPVPDGWLGLAFSPRGDRVYVGGGARDTVFEFTFQNGALKPARTFAAKPEKERTERDFIGDVALTPDGHLLYAADLYNDAVIVFNTQSGITIERFKTGRRPYRILFHPDGKSFFVTSWADGTLSQYEALNGSPLGTLRVAPHPTDMVWKTGKSQQAEGETPWTARIFVAAANTNQVYAVGITAEKEMRLIEAINVSLTAQQPVGMTPSALALAENRLFVVCSDANAVAVVDVSGERSDPLGLLPAGWYPTAARVLPEGALAVLNGAGGSASIIPAFNDQQLLDYTRTVLDNAAWRESKLDERSPLPSIEHVIYIVGEDQAPGPEQEKLAREFVRLDHFYANGDGAEGLNWAIAGIAPDYTRKLWPATAAGRRHTNDFEGQEPANVPPAGYLWTNARTAGLELRNFGFFVTNLPREKATAVQVQAVRDPVLAHASNLHYRGEDAEYPDRERVKAFLAELAEWEKTGQAPRLTLIRLGGAPDSDAALGMLVEAVSRSRLWARTAIFVTGAKAALVISPYAKRHGVDSAMYNTTSVLRTMEMLLGLRPMTQFDAAARPMTACFQTAADPAPYTAAARGALAK